MSYRYRPPVVAILLVSFLLLQNTSLSFSSPTRIQDNDEVVRVDSDLVVLNVTVSDASGNFVTDLKKSDFKILEDGVEQRISSFEAEETPFAAAVLLDF